MAIADDIWPGFWRRRWWRPDAQALAAFDGLTPAVVITGASRGIGLELARQFSAGGHLVVMIARDGERLEAAAALLRRSTKSRIASLALDITAPDALTRLNGTLAAMGAYADILVNNAGYGLAGPLASQSPEALAGLIALNVTAVTALCRHVLPGQLVRGRGGVINIASLGGLVPGPYQAAYYASKAYVISLSQALAAETAGYGVRVLAVTPGPVDTGFHAQMGAETALYRKVLPELSPAKVARSAIRGFRLGLHVVVPGWLNKALRLGAWVLPASAVAIISAVLLRPRPQLAAKGRKGER